MKIKRYSTVTLKRSGFGDRVKRDFIRNKWIYLMLVPVILYFAVFCYVPMYGAIIAFKNYNVAKGIIGSDWAGFKWFTQFFTSYQFPRLMKNTLLLSFQNIIWGFPMPIIFALLINEIRNNFFKRTVQTITYLPHFISMVVVCSLIRIAVAEGGFVTSFLAMFGVENTNLLARPENFRTIYIVSGIWQEVGWGTIIYLSALTAIDPSLYEAARIDGAGKWRQTLHITIPGILPTIVIMLILRIGQLMGIGYEKVMLLESTIIRETSDIISTYVYRVGLLEGGQYSYTTAIGLFNSLINVILLVTANRVSNKLSGQGLW